MSNYMDMTRPCPKCPFRSDIPGYLRRSRVREIQHHLTTGDGRFTCHETTVPDDDSGEMYDGPNAKHCAGAMILLHKTGDYNQMMRLAARLLAMRGEAIDQDNPLGLDLDAPVYESFAAMVKAQPR